MSNLAYSKTENPFEVYRSYPADLKTILLLLLTERLIVGKAAGQKMKKLPPVAAWRP
ncbi:hypothetical protein X474_24955 [Dethiosulfatarculus sandiegensis]|uniref:Uncharacterized protein n=1 Tax=Dethiosulfatarculus sandiegensis TaxID=1429043 RepID=A0A0D2JQ40_9BACT|nr:hypothetical protein X474_24955 [Dethiosulfatarculus sandiegensis]